MTDYQESVILAAITVVLVAIPAASQNVEIKGAENDIGLIKSDFSDKFKVDFSTGEQVTTYLDRKSKLKVNKSFDKNIRKLETAKGSVKIVKTNNIINKTVQTPYGDFNFGVKNGQNFSSYTGENKEKAKDVKDSVLERLKKRKSEAKDKREVVIEKLLPNIRLSVEDNSAYEHFNLTNTGDKKVKMSAWTAAFSDGESVKDTLNLKRRIKPGETIIYYSGSSSGKVIGNNQVEIDSNIYSSGKITIYNQAEKVVAKSDY